MLTQRFYPYGTMRSESGTSPTERKFTGQRFDAADGLYFYQSRYFDPVVGRFLQPDSVVPAPDNPQSLNRFAYVLNNPLRYIDPSGHCSVGDYADESLCVRRDARGNDVIVTGGNLNYVERSIANYYLTGEERYLNRTPDRLVGGGWAIQHAYTALYGGQSLGGMMAAGLSSGLAFNPTGVEMGIRAMGGGIAAVVARGIDTIRQGFGPNSAQPPTIGPYRIGTYRELQAAGITDAHHIVQDAAVRDLPGYSKLDARAIELPGPSNKLGTPHYYATLVQRQAGGGTYAAERRIAYKALRQAGLTVDEARTAIEWADEYFTSIGLSPTTVTRIPGNR